MPRYFKYSRGWINLNQVAYVIDRSTYTLTKIHISLVGKWFGIELSGNEAKRFIKEVCDAA